MKHPTQSERVLEYMATYGSITPLEALRDLGVFRLAARIHDLRREGHNVVKGTETVHNRFGYQVSIASYSIKSDLPLFSSLSKVER